MELTKVVEAIGEDLRRAGALGGDEGARLADLLVSSLASTVRLHLLEALHEAAQELAESAPGVNVDVRLVGREPVLSLSYVAPEEEQGDGEVGEGLGGYAADELARLTVRIPEGLKTRLERVAAAAGASVNSWIVVTLAGALDSPQAQRGGRPGRRVPRRMTGFVQG
ncbi:MAG TPA: hypothetical protein VMD59_14095 [Acidimicrobiales bacterium]|nr:hypothetical protein [Acidimicrobiales bacterium]